MSIDKVTGMLRQRRKTLAAYEFVHCGMSHERVQHDSGTLRPLKNSTVEHGYLRHGLCSKALRQNRPGCGHTMARNVMTEVLETMGVHDETHREQLAVLSRRLKEIDLKICLLDHRKGDTELLRAARADEVGLLAAGQDKWLAVMEHIDSEVSALEDEHASYVDALARLRDEMLVLLDELIQVRSGGAKEQSRQVSR